MGECRIEAGTQRRRYVVVSRRDDGGDAAHGGALLGWRSSPDFSLPVFG
jgi:hypothetical protein